MAEESDASNRAFAVHDDEVPLALSHERQVFREQGGADFTVTAVDAVVKGTGQRMTLHFASVKDDRPGAVCVAVLDNPTNPHGEKRFLVARHWRAAVGQWEWEFPRGMGEPGETQKETSVREFHEETGILADCSQVRVLQTIHADTGVLRDNITVTVIEFSSDDECRRALARVPMEIADNAERSSFGDGAGNQAQADSRPQTDWELSHMRWVTESDLKGYIAQGGIVDGVTLSSFFLYLLY